MKIRLIAVANGLTCLFRRRVIRLEMPTSGSTSYHADADRRAILLQQWERALANVRELDGFGTFLVQPGVDKSLIAGEPGPIVVVNSASWRSDALIINNGEVLRKELPDLDNGEMHRRSNEYLIALQRAERAADLQYLARRALREDTSMANRQAAHRAELALRDARSSTRSMLTAMLAWLWEVVAAPILDELGFDRTPADPDNWPRLWWCPTGHLNMLPLHAAGQHADAAGLTVIDRVISSYTPTLRALAEARRRDDVDDSSAKNMLVIAQPDTPGQRPLAGVRRDVELLRRAVSRGAPYDPGRRPRRSRDSTARAG